MKRTELRNCPSLETTGAELGHRQRPSRATRPAERCARTAAPGGSHAAALPSKSRSLPSLFNSLARRRMVMFGAAGQIDRSIASLGNAVLGQFRAGDFPADPPAR